MVRAEVPENSMRYARWINEALPGVNLDRRVIAKGRLETAIEHETHSNGRVYMKWRDGARAVLD